jgi:5-methylcytosine-specific restriction endonuclease McrBC regulatory subunit McrC
MGNELRGKTLVYNYIHKQLNSSAPRLHDEYDNYNKKNRLKALIRQMFRVIISALVVIAMCQVFEG